MAFRVDSFRECIDTWARSNEEGAKIIASINRNNPEKTAENLCQVVNGLKQTLEKMYEIYDTAAATASTASLPPVASQLRACIEMFDQEYMVKECILSVLTKPDYFTQQHLNGTSAIWTTEPYIDRSCVNAFISNKSD